MATSTSRSSTLKPSVYVPRLRRAFLLQVHPDRFRSQSEDVRKQQAKLVQALSDRMAEHDFLVYTASSSKQNPNLPSQYHVQGGKSSANGIYPFSVEKKDGTISNQSIQLNNSNPYQILGRMAESINFPPPPLPRKHHDTMNTMYPQNNGGGYNCAKFDQNGAKRSDVDDFIFSHGWGSYQRKTPNSIDRDVLHFLKKMDFSDIKQRKLDRINATAAALVARRSFKFSAVDGTGLGWSSASLAILLSRLTSLHEEHHSKFRVESFYPFRLLLSSDELQQKVDLYGGIIRLHPAATTIQWLGTLLSVTDGSIASYKRKQIELKKNLAKVEDTLGLRAVKGHSCVPVEYHRCVANLAIECDQQKTRGEGKSIIPAVSKATLVIESSQTCRRGRLRKDGNFQVGAGMDLNEMRKTIAQFANRSSEQIQLELEKRAQVKELVDQVMYEFGAQKVTRSGTLVDSDQMIQCLSFLLSKDETEKNSIRGYMAGQSVGIASRGHLCHLGDDGSIIIPSNCT